MKAGGKNGRSKGLERRSSSFENRMESMKRKKAERERRRERRKLIADLLKTGENSRALAMAVVRWSRFKLIEIKFQNEKKRGERVLK